MRQSLIAGCIAAFVVCSLFTTSLVAIEREANQDGDPNVRRFRLEYQATLSHLPSNARIRVWLPVPPSNEHQTVQVLKQDLPVAGTMAVEPTYGNKILYFEAKGPESGSLPFGATYLVERKEVRGVDGKAEQQLSAEDRRLFLSANANVPLAGKQLELLEGLDLPNPTLELARKLYDRVDEHVKYDKSRPGYGNGNVRWVCNSRFGNCTDFHSLFISWARAKGVPARFEIGFPLPPENSEGQIGGYHCWALFHDKTNGWVPVDISEADKNPDMKEYYFGNLTEDRVTFTTGRDIELVPRQDGPPLNYFVYPHIEVDGKPWPKDKIQLSFSFEDSE